jgi:hypothetical protein
MVPYENLMLEMEEKAENGVIKRNEKVVEELGFPSNFQFEDSAFLEIIKRDYERKDRVK